MAGKANNQGRLEALEHSHQMLHNKLDQALGTTTPSVPGEPLLVDAYGRPVVPAQNERKPAPVAVNQAAELVKLLMPLIKAAQAPAPVAVAPGFDWAPVLAAVIPALIERLFDRPDPIEQMAAIKELMSPDMGETAMTALMPALIAKMTAGGGGAAANPGEVQDAVKQALAGIDPAILAQFAALQAGADGADGAT